MEEYLVKKPTESIRESHMGGAADCLGLNAQLVLTVWAFVAYWSG